MTDVNKVASNIVSALRVLESSRKELLDTLSAADIQALQASTVLKALDKVTGDVNGDIIEHFKGEVMNARVLAEGYKPSR